MSTDAADLPAPTTVNKLEVEAALEAIDPDIAEPEWFEIDAALYNALGDAAGFEAYDRWSAGGTKYPGRLQMQSKWRTIAAKGYAFTIGTLFYQANESDPDWWKKCREKNAANAGSKTTGNGSERSGLTDEQFAELAQLAELPTAEYDRKRKEVAKRFGIRVGTLDGYVVKIRPRSTDDSAQGKQLQLADPEPWPEPVDGEVLLADVEAAIRRHVALSEDQALAAALFTIHAHAADAADHFPRLHIASPAKRCGIIVIGSGKLTRPAP